MNIQEWAREARELLSVACKVEGFMACGSCGDVKECVVDKLLATYPSSSEIPNKSDTVRDEGIPDDIEWKRCPSNKEASLLSEAVRKLQHIIENVVKEPDGYSVRTHAVEFFMETRDILARAAELEEEGKG